MPKKKTKKKEATKHWLLRVETFTDSDELFITLPDDLLNSVKWKIGDTLFWTPKGDSWVLTKVDKK